MMQNEKKTNSLSIDPMRRRNHARILPNGRIRLVRGKDPFTDLRPSVPGQRDRLNAGWSESAQQGLGGPRPAIEPKNWFNENPGARRGRQ